MADLFVRPSNGDDTIAKASNDVNNQWSSLRRAIHDAVANDVIIVDAPDEDNAVRQMMYLDKDITIKSTDGQKLFVTPSFNVSEGGVYELFENEDYMSALPTPTGFAQVFGTPSVDAVNELLGTGCILLNGSASTAGIRKSYSYKNKRPTRFKILYKSEASSVFDLQIRGAANDYDLSTLSWVAPTHRNVIPNSGGVWSEYITPWIDGADDGGMLTLRATVADVRVQRIITEYQATWELGTSGDEIGKYKIPYVRPTFGSIYEISDASIAGNPHDISPMLFKCTNAAWVANGKDALVIVAGSDALANTEAGESFNDHGNAIFYYHPEAGETPSNMHFEISRSGVGVNPVSACLLEDMTIFAAQQPFKADTSDEVNGYRLKETASVLLGFTSINTGITNLHSCISQQAFESLAVKYYGGGFVAGRAVNADLSVMNCYGCKAIFAGDDSFQPIGAGNLNIYGCTSHKPAGSAIELNTDNVGGGMIIRGFTGMDAEIDGNSFRDQSVVVTTVDMENCAFETMVFAGAAGKSYTVGNAVHCRSSDATGANIPAAVTLATGDVSYSATIEFEDEANGDFTPRVTSDLYKAGDRYWTGANPVGADGEPFSDVHTDAGGIQSTHSNIHPVNL